MAEMQVQIAQLRFQRVVSGRRAPSGRRREPLQFAAAGHQFARGRLQQNLMADLDQSRRERHQGLRATVGRCLLRRQPRRLHIDRVLKRIAVCTQLRQ